MAIISNRYIKKLNGANLKRKNIGWFLSKDRALVEKINMITKCGLWMFINGVLTVSIASLIMGISIIKGVDVADLAQGLAQGLVLLGLAIAVYQIIYGYKLKKLEVTPEVLKTVCIANIIISIIMFISDIQSDVTLQSLAIFIRYMPAFMSVRVLVEALSIFAEWFKKHANDKREKNQNISVLSNDDTSAESNRVVSEAIGESEDPQK